MRRFWYDTEFIERPGLLDLISIGVVSDDGREYYAVSTEFDESQANEWVRENVIAKLPPRTDPAWKSRAQIKADLIEFFRPDPERPIELWGYFPAYDHVALCWLFGAMMDLPNGMPMFTHDITQWMSQTGTRRLPKHEGNVHEALEDARWTRDAWRFLAANSRKSA